MHPRLVLVLSVAVTATPLVGCSTFDRLANLGEQPPLSAIENPTTQAGYKPVHMPMPTPQPASYSPNSLWRNGSRAFFKDQRAHQVGDILTVIVNLNDKAVIANETQRSRENKEDSGIDALFGAKKYPIMNTPVGTRIFTGDSSSSSDGKGSVNRSEALVKNFAGQWLMLRNLQSVLPDPNEFPNFDDNLRQAFRKETEMFFASIVREDRSVLDLLNADYTFANERLAKHYGIPGIYGSQFRRVKLTGEERRGLLGQGSVLTVTSEANRTSPVKRGKFILEAILGTPPPAPPPNVPPLKENEGAQAQSVRARLEEHRKNPACASCHAVMDPLGFSLENFDGVGEWRTKEPGGVVDPSGQLADGTKVDGPVALRQAIMKHPEQFVRTLTEKMMTYGLGRGLEYYDMPTVRRIAMDASRSDYKFSSIVLGIVNSTPFKMRRVQDVPVSARAE